MGKVEGKEEKEVKRIESKTINTPYITKPIKNLIKNNL